MRLSFVSAHYAPFVGGVESHLNQLAKRIAATGHDVTVLTHGEQSSGLPPVEWIDGVVVRRFPVPVPSTNYALSPALWRYLAGPAQKSDIVHAHGYHALPALAAAIVKRCGFVFTPHYHGTGHSPFRKLLHPPYRRLGRLIFDRADRTIAVSPPEAELILSHFPGIRRRLVVIPNGVDQELLDASEPFSVEQTVVLSAGRIELYKQVDKTVMAMADLPDSFVLRVTGDGGARSDVEDLARQQGLDARVEFLGRVSERDLYRWFRTARVYVSMSSNEAMPVTLIESLAAGASVVASDIPAHRDLVRKTKGSITLVPLDAPPSAVANAILEQVRQPVAQPSIDTWDDVAAQTISLYDDVLAGARRTA